jgi:hypothetical protein
MEELFSHRTPYFNVYHRYEIMMLSRPHEDLFDSRWR